MSLLCFFVVVCLCEGVGAVVCGFYVLLLLMFLVCEYVAVRASYVSVVVFVCVFV